MRIKLYIFSILIPLGIFAISALATRSYPEFRRENRRAPHLAWLSQDTLSPFSNQRIVLMKVNDDSLLLDSLSILPGSLQVFHKDQPLSPEDWRLDAIHGMLILRDTTLYDSLTIRYSVFPIEILDYYVHKDTAQRLSRERDPFKPFVIGSSRQLEEMLSEDGLQKSGSISRGIAFGNSQNVSVNSSLNLQMTGKLTSRFNLLASVTDDNIPIQPDGNTQQLQDFDQVFIQLYDEHTKLIAGDFILRKPEGYFLNYFKRAQGAYFMSDAMMNKKTIWNLHTEASAVTS